MHFLILFLTTTLLLFSPIEQASGKDSPCETKIWEADIENFLVADAENPSQQAGVLFVGSSSIRLWDLEKYFPKIKPLNRGFGGSEICQSTRFAQQLILKHKPSVVVFYAGDNDISNGKSAEQVYRDYLAFWKKLHQALPETRLLYIAIKPSIARWKLAPAMKIANEKIAAECEKHKLMQFVDIWEPMLGNDGKPKKELFIEDGLHLNDMGYTLWTKLVNESLETSK